MLNSLVQLYLRLVIQRKFVMLFFYSLIIAISLVGVPKFAIDASSDSILLEGDSSLQFYQQSLRRFNSGDILVVAYSTKQGDVYSNKAISQISELTKRLKQINRVQSVISITNAPLFFSPKGDIQALLRTPRTLTSEGTDKNLAAKEFDFNPLYKNTLVSADRKSTVILLNLSVNQDYLQLVLERDALLKQQELNGLSDVQKIQLKHLKQSISSMATQSQKDDRLFIQQIEAIASHYKQSADIEIGGATMITVNMIDFVKQDMQLFGSLIVLMVVLVLWLLFKQWQLVLLPLISCLSIIVIMIGMLGWLNWKVTLISSNFAIFLFIVSLATCIHLLIRFKEFYHEGGSYSLDESIIAMLKRMWSPCLYNMFTTVLAFSSLVVSGIRPVIDFGWIMAIGVFLALLLCFVIIPVGLGLFNHLPRQNLSQRQGQWLNHLGHWVTEHHRSIMVMTLVVTIIAVTGLFKLSVENRFIDFFKEGTTVARNMTFIDRHFGGTMPLDIILSAPAKMEISETVDSSQLTDDELFTDEDLFAEDDLFKDEGSEQEVLITYWWSRAGIEQIQKLHNFLEQQPEIGKVYSLATGYQLATQLLNIEIGDVELSILRKQLGDVEEQIVTPFLDDEVNQTRISMRIFETTEHLNRNELMQRIQHFAEKDMQLKPEQFHYTGLMHLYNNMLQSLYNSQILTLATVFIAIFMMVAILFRSFILAAIAITPNIIAALLILGMMGHTGISLDFMTITIAAITIGIGIDYAIHYIYRFKHELAEQDNSVQAITNSHSSIGRSLLFSALTIICGFSVLLFSNFIPLVSFAILTSIAMLSALIGVMTLVPRLLLLRYKSTD